MKMTVEVEIPDEDLICLSCVALEEKALQEKISNPCFNCGNTAECNHHVVPKSLGGIATVPLCLSCHGKVHEKDLVKMGNLRKEGSDNRKEEGGFVGGPPPFGWKSVIDPASLKRKILVKNEHEQKIIGDLIHMREISKFSYEYISLHIDTVHQVGKHPSTWMRIYDRAQQSRMFLRTKDL